MWSPAERVRRAREVIEIVDRLLRGDARDYLGRFYRVEQAAMSPGPLQSPRPPLVVGANGPAMLEIAARYADTWNTWGGYGLDSKGFLRVTEQRVARVDAACEAIGRDPASLRRSVLVHHGAFDAWATQDTFVDIVTRFHRMHFGECIFYWPGGDRYDQFIDIATTAIPELRHQLADE